jgi:CRP-like cAMP-binding protein
MAQSPISSFYPASAPTLQELSSGPLAELAPRVRFWKGMEIGVQGEPCSYLYIIAEGHVLLSRRSPVGEDYALYLLGVGDLFGEGSLRPEQRWLVTARAVSDGLAHRLPASHLPSLARHFPDLTAKIVTLICSRIERAHRRLDAISVDGAPDRLLYLLHTLAASHAETAPDGQTWLALPLTQAELGEMIGLKRETVARALAQLEARGLIRREGRKGLWLSAPPNP